MVRIYLAAEASCVFWLTVHLGCGCPGGNPWTRTSAQRFLHVSKNGTTKPTDLPKAVWYTHGSHKQLKWPNFQLVTNHSFLHRHVEKLNTKPQIMKGHFSTPSSKQPQCYPSTLFSYNYTFQRISSNLILPISGENLPEDSVVYPRCTRSWGNYGASTFH